MKMVLNFRLERGSMLWTWPICGPLLAVPFSLKQAVYGAKRKFPPGAYIPAPCHTPASESTELIREHSPCTGSHSSKHRDFPKLSSSKYW